MTEYSLEEMLEAEAYFYALFTGKKKLPMSDQAQSYQELVKYTTMAKTAYGELVSDSEAEDTLKDARTKSLLRQQRKGIPNRVVDLKEGIKYLGERQVCYLADVVSDPASFSALRKTISEYCIELTYKILQARNSLVEIKEGTCAEAGSVLLVVDRDTGDVFTDADKSTEFRYFRDTLYDLREGPILRVVK